MRWRGINHLAMVTTDMEATARFYHDVLGMELVATTGHGDPTEPGYPHRHYFFRLGEGNTIAFFEWPEVETGASKPAGIPADEKFDHVSFNLASVEDLLELRQRLIEAGYSVTEVIDHKIVYSIYFDDPVNEASLEASVWVRDVERAPYFGDPDPTPTALRVAKAADVGARPPGEPSAI